MDLATETAAGLLALYLAVLFQAFGSDGRPADARGTFFDAGIGPRYSVRYGRLSVALVFGAFVAFMGGEVVALTRGPAAVAAAALVYLAIVVSIRPGLWALKTLSAEWVDAHVKGVLDTACAAPFAAAFVAGGLVAFI